MNVTLDRLASFVQFSLFFCYESYYEILHIIQTPKSNEEYDIIKGNPFNFYGITLQYCFIMEYTKLMEDDLRSEGKNLASLNRLNIEVKKTLEKKYENIFNENKRLLSEIRKSDLCKHLKELRHNKFAHSGNQPINEPFKVAGFTIAQINELGKQVNQFLKIANNCFNHGLGIHFLLSNNDETANFIRFHAKYKGYYFKHFEEAIKEGYGIG